MTTFLQFLTEDKIKNIFDKTIALVAGSYRPPHAGHFDMVYNYAKNADQVIILISSPKSEKSLRKTCFGTTITPEMSKKIWEMYIKKYNLNNVSVEISKEASPITAMFKYVDDNLKDVNVIFGVSKKDGDENRFKTALKYYEDNEHINLIDPLKSAVEPFKTSNGDIISATDIRNNLDNPSKLVDMLPSKLSINDIKQIIKILKVDKQNESELQSKIHEVILDNFGYTNIQLTDNILNQSKLLCYDIGQTVKDDDGKEIPVNPKKFPVNAIYIQIPISKDIEFQIFFNATTKCWDSNCISAKDKFKLSPEQMEQFFNSLFYQRLIKKLKNIWPLSDEFHNSLFNGILARQMFNGSNSLCEEKEEDEQDDEKRKYTASGRKIIKFTDNNTSSSDAKFYCWPNKEKLYNWSTWKDWKKIKPLCRIRFKHGELHYGLSLSAIKDDYKNRGFRGYDVDTEPHLQWLSKEENESVMKLSIVNKFIKQCIKHIEEAISLDPKEIYEKINNKDKITIDEITTTINIVRKTLNEIIKPMKIDSFRWGN